MNNKNLIFLPDSPYSNWIIERSEKLGFEENVYVCCDGNIKHINHPNCFTLLYASSEFNLLVGDIKLFKRIIIHYHKAHIAHFLIKRNIKGIKIIWVLWGGDLYATDFYKKSIFQKKTKKLIKATNKNLQWYFKEYVKFILGKPNYFYYKRSFQLIQYIASTFELDVQIAKETFDKDYIFEQFRFLSINELFDVNDLDSKGRLGSKIMVGHAGSPANNHLEAFDLISKASVENKVFCPLSYGDKEYIMTVERAGLQIFPLRFECIKVFLPKLEYYKLLSDVGYAVFNANIQIGFGNILALIYKGVKVFLNKENSIYYQFKKWGIQVFEVGEILDDGFLSPLSEIQIRKNREIIFSLFNDDVVNKYYLNLYRL